MPKACQYATNETKMGVGMKEISLTECKLLSKRQLLKLKSSGRVDMNGKRFVVRLVSSIENSRPL
jgi:hypothetical protein